MDYIIYTHLAFSGKITMKSWTCELKQWLQIMGLAFGPFPSVWINEVAAFQGSRLEGVHCTVS